MITFFGPLIRQFSRVESVYPISILKYVCIKVFEFR